MIIRRHTTSFSDLLDIAEPTQLPIFVGSGPSHAPGAVPDPGVTAGATRFLREDGIWLVPAGGGGGGSVLGVDVWSLSGNPGAVTDWGPILNAAYAAGMTYFLFSSHPFPFTTPLDFDGSNDVILEGPGGLVWSGNTWLNALTPAYLLWKGTGSGHAITAIEATGFTIRNMGVYYDQAGYTGTLIALGSAGSVSAKALLVNSVMRSTPASGLQTARAIVTLDQAIVCTIQNCVIGFAQYGVTGIETGFSNANRLLNNVFDHCVVASIGNTGAQWTIDSNTFEMSGASGPSVIASIGNEGGFFTFSNNWVGDYSAAGVPFIQSAGSTWTATFSGNIITTFGSGLIWQLAGGGTFSIHDNPQLVNGNVPIVDLVSATTPKELFWFANDSSCSGASEAILNRTGHRLHLQGSVESRILGITEVERERLAYPTAQARPTIAPTAAAGTGAATFIFGSDVAGEVVLTAGSASLSAGEVVVVTFGTPMVAPPGSPAAQPLPFLQVYNTPALIDAGLYVSSVSSTTFGIGFKVAPVASTNYFLFYRVIWM